MSRRVFDHDDAADEFWIFWFLEILIARRRYQARRGAFFAASAANTPRNLNICTLVRKSMVDFTITLSIV